MLDPVGALASTPSSILPSQLSSLLLQNSVAAGDISSLLSLQSSSLSTYPLGWELELPNLGIKLNLSPDLYDQELYNSATSELSLLTPVFGGAKRQDSVRLGLESLEALNPANVLIHDSVRPFVSDEIIDEILLVVAEGKCCVPGIAPVDTVKRVEKGYVVESLNRSDIWQIQTPQGFLYSEILSAHRSLIGDSLTDDAAVAEAYGLAVTVIPGSAENIKITQSKQKNANSKYSHFGGKIRPDSS